MGKSKQKSKSSLNAPLVDAQQKSDEDFDDSNEKFSVAAATYDPHTEQLISRQAASALLYLLFYSILMFTLPFGAFFGTRHFLREHTDYTEFTVTALSVISSVIMVYIIIALYAWHAYREKDVVLPGDETNDPKIEDTSQGVSNETKSKKNKQKNL